MSADFAWNQILVLGDHGAGKTTTAIKMAYLFYRWAIRVLQCVLSLWLAPGARGDVYATFPISTLQDVS